MKKGKVLIVLIAALFLVGCKKQTQKDFTEELVKQEEMNAGDYSLVVEKVLIEVEDADASTRTSMDMISKMLSGTKISGTYLKNDQKEIVETEMAIETFGQNIPVNLFIDKKNHTTFLNAEIYKDVTDIAKEFNKEVSTETNNFEQLNGKFIQITKEDVAKIIGTDLFGENSNSEVFRKYLTTLDSDTFEVNGETIKRKFTKKDMIGFIKFAKKEKDSGNKQIIKELEKSIDQLTDYKQTTTLNLKNHTQKTKMFGSVKKDNTIINLELEITNHAKKSKKQVVLPEKENRIPLRELEEIYQTSNSAIPSDDFNTLLEELKVNRDRFTQEQINQIKQTYKPYLTDEQYKKLEDVLMKSNTNAS